MVELVAPGALVASGGLTLPVLQQVKEFALGPVTGASATLGAVWQTSQGGTSQDIFGLNGFPLGIQAGAGMKLLAWDNLLLVYTPGVCV